MSSNNCCRKLNHEDPAIDIDRMSELQYWELAIDDGSNWNSEGNLDCYRVGTYSFVILVFDLWWEEERNKPIREVDDEVELPMAVTIADPSLDIVEGDEEVAHNGARRGQALRSSDVQKMSPIDFGGASQKTTWEPCGLSSRGAASITALGSSTFSQASWIDKDRVIPLFFVLISYHYHYHL